MNFTRTIFYATFNAGEFTFENGKADVLSLGEFQMSASRHITKDMMLRYAKQQLNRRDNIIVYNVMTSSEVRSITFEEFMEHSTTIVRPQSQRKDD